MDKLHIVRELTEALHADNTHFITSSVLENNISAASHIINVHSRVSEKLPERMLNKLNVKVDKTDLDIGRGYLIIEKLQKTLDFYEYSNKDIDDVLSLMVKLIETSPTNLHIRNQIGIKMCKALDNTLTNYTYTKPNRPGTFTNYLPLGAYIYEAILELTQVQIFETSVVLYFDVSPLKNALYIIGKRVRDLKYGSIDMVKDNGNNENLKLDPFLSHVFNLNTNWDDGDIRWMEYLNDVDFNKYVSLLKMETDELENNFMSDLYDTLELVTNLSDGDVTTLTSNVDIPLGYTEFINSLKGKINSDTVINSIGLSNRTYGRHINLDPLGMEVIIDTMLEHTSDPNRVTLPEKLLHQVSIPDTKGERVHFVVTSTPLNDGSDVTHLNIAALLEHDTQSQHVLVLLRLSNYNKLTVNPVKLTGITRTLRCSLKYINSRTSKKKTVTESMSVYLDKDERKFKIRKKKKFEDVHRSFKDTMFYLRMARRSKNIDAMKKHAVQLMELLIYVESVIYDEKTNIKSEDTQKHITLRANIISELYKVIATITATESDFNFEDYFLNETKKTNHVPVDALIDAIGSVYQTVLRNATKVLI